MYSGPHLCKVFCIVLILFLGLMLAACTDFGHAHEHVDMPVRDRTQQPKPAQLADMVASHSVPGDSKEINKPRKVLYLIAGLDQDVRGNLLSVNGVVNGGSRDAIYHILEDEPGVHTVVLTSVPGSANDEVNLEVGRLLHDIGMTTYLSA